MSNSERRRLQTSSWFAVVRTYQECNRRYAQLMHAFDLTITQFDVLSAVHKLADSAMPMAIADELVVTRGNITGVIQRLRQKGLLATRHHEKDGRSFVCELTPDGNELLRKARSAAALFIERQMTPFDEEELRDTERQMNRMHVHLKTIDPDAIAESVLRTRITEQTEGWSA